MLIVSGLPSTQREYDWKVTTKGNWAFPCFAKGTKILMKDKSYKNIEDINVGEYVISYNLEKKEFTTSKVLRVIHRKDPALIIVNGKLKRRQVVD